MRDFKYIFKRILIGVGIAVVLSYLRGYGIIANVQAKSVSSVDFGDWSQGVSVTQSTSQIARYFNNGSWAGWGSGLLYGSASISKSQGGSTDDIPVLNAIKSISSNGQEYQCFFGSISKNNSTHEDTVYSFYCPMSMGLNGLEGMVVSFAQQATSVGAGNFIMDGTLTFVQDDNVSFDTSGIISSNNSNTQAVRDIGNQITNATNSNTQQIRDSGNQINSSINQTNNNIMNDDVSSSTSTASGFFDDFQSNSHGLSGIISSPLRLIQSLSSSSCSPLVIPLPFVNNNATLPCMSTIYTTHFNSFLTIYRLITTGLIGYWVCVRLFSKVKDFQNPNNDKIEVLNL